MDVNKQPGISFDNIILVEDKFWRDHNVPPNSELKFKIDTEWSSEADDYFVNVSPSLKLVNEKEEEVLVLECKFIGMFSVIESEKNMDIEKYVNSNAIGLMYPYIREHISSITQKAGIKPILLPPINISALLNKKD